MTHFATGSVVREEFALLPHLLTAHLALTLFPLLVGVCLSIPLGILCARSQWLEHLALNAAGIVQTVPSLALLALMVPLLGALGITSIGFLPAFLALVLYSVLPILRNTVTGLAGLDPAITEAALGVGMNARQRLLRVELPLALPIIVAGVRTATVWTVGAATLATPVGADSLGNYIFAGLQTRNVASVLVGCVASAALALGLDGLGRVLLAGVTRSNRGLTWTALAAFGALYLYAGSALASRAAGARNDTIAIGAKTFTEQYILSQILAGQISRTTGYPCEVKQSLGSSVVFDALAGGSIDAYVDYSGTIWSTVMKRTEVPAERADLVRQMKTFLLEQRGIQVVARLGFENSYALAMRRSRAQELGVHSISELSSLSPRLVIGGDYEFFGRPEWKSLTAAYGLKFQAQTAMDSSLMYQAVHQGVIDVLSAFSTDGRIVALDLVVLDDDRRAIPPYDAVVLAGKRLAREHPRALEALRRLSGRIGAQQMRAMNLEVDAGGVSPRATAQHFLSELMSNPPMPGAAP